MLSQDRGVARLHVGRPPLLRHTLVIKGLIGSQSHPTHMTDYYLLVVLAGSVMLSFLAAGALWLCVEAPVAGLVRAARTRTGGSGWRGNKLFY
ncbi:unnamed protein product [Parnassius apollo]|uniref:(apollo) hypothetical protein n=1 Tax=Parnassius apollo TaxID=110799 RepID=A0A8S3XEG5_PARAO|nr:unnamed protein product [Parnassius apollo]